MQRSEYGDFAEWLSISSSIPALDLVEFAVRRVAADCRLCLIPPDHRTWWWWIPNCRNGIGCCFHCPCSWSAHHRLHLKTSENASIASFLSYGYAVFMNRKQAKRSNANWRAALTATSIHIGTLQADMQKSAGSELLRGGFRPFSKVVPVQSKTEQVGRNKS